MKKNLKELVIITLSLLISGGILYAADKNVPPPINVGDALQEKDGGLRVLSVSTLNNSVIKADEASDYIFNAAVFEKKDKKGKVVKTEGVIVNGILGVNNGLLSWYMNRGKIEFDSKLPDNKDWTLGEPAISFYTANYKKEYHKVAYIMVGSNKRGKPIASRLVISANNDYNGKKGILLNSANTAGTILFTIGDIWDSEKYQKLLELSKYGLSLGKAVATSCNATTTGTIRWTGKDFEGCVNGKWVSLTQGGAGGTGYWKASPHDPNNIYYGTKTEGKVGIGTDNPSEKLEVVGGPIKATGGLIIQVIDHDPNNRNRSNNCILLPHFLQ